MDTPEAFSRNVRSRYRDLLAGIERNGRPIFCGMCTEVRKVREEEADAWVASLRRIMCRDCDKILSAEELSATQRKKSLANRRCRDCAKKREMEGTNVGEDREAQPGESEELSCLLDVGCEAQTE